MADVTKIVSHVLNTPGDENSVLVNYTDGTEMKFSLKEWQQIISKGKEAYSFISCDEDYQRLLAHENKY
jgi:hypothetical protein